MLRKIVLNAALILGTALTFAAPLRAQAYPDWVPLEQRPFYMAFGIDSRTCTPCRLSKSDGGDLEVFRLAAKELKAEAEHNPLVRVVVDGPFSSAATTFAIDARPYVSITHKAQFGFHMARAYPWFSATQSAGVFALKPGAKFIGYIKPYDPPEIAKWVKENGPPTNDGYPTEVLLIMGDLAASNFWPYER